MELIAPSFWVLKLACLHALFVYDNNSSYERESIGFAYFAIIVKKVPKNISPAPVVSIGVTFGALTLPMICLYFTIAPFLPSVNKITGILYFSSSFKAAIFDVVFVINCASSDDNFIISTKGKTLVIFFYC